MGTAPRHGPARPHGSSPLTVGAPETRHHGTHWEHLATFLPFTQKRRRFRAKMPSSTCSVLDHLALKWYMLSPSSSRVSRQLEPVLQLADIEDHWCAPHTFSFLGLRRKKSGLVGSPGRRPAQWAAPAGMVTLKALCSCGSQPGEGSLLARPPARTRWHSV
jgi:hypothetical protein